MEVENDSNDDTFTPETTAAKNVSLQGPIVLELGIPRDDVFLFLLVALGSCHLHGLRS